MRTYVKSRGSSRLHEYVWINQDHQEDELSQKYKLSIINHSFPIDSDSSKVVRITGFHSLTDPAIIVLREGQDLLILLTGIKAEWNAPGSAVYHSVAWLSQEEKIIRKLVIHALEGKLQNNVTSAITSSDSKLGFQVDFDRLNQFDFDKSLSLEGDKASKIDMSVKNTQELKDKLAIELTKNCLPESNGFLVVVSDFVSEPFLKEVKVWRGLTSRSEHYDWDEDLPKKKAISIHPPSSLPTQEAPSNPTMQPNPIQESDRFIAQPKKKILGLVLFVMGMLVGMVIGLMLALSFLGAKLPVLPVSQPAQEKQTLNQSNQNFLKSLPSLENQAPSQMNPPAPNQIDQTLIDQFQQIPQRVEPFGKELINQ